MGRRKNKEKRDKKTKIRQANQQESQEVLGTESILASIGEAPEASKEKPKRRDSSRRESNPRRAPEDIQARIRSASMSQKQDAVGPFGEPTAAFQQETAKKRKKSVLEQAIDLTSALTATKSKSTRRRKKKKKSEGGRKSRSGPPSPSPISEEGKQASSGEGSDGGDDGVAF